MFTPDPPPKSASRKHRIYIRTGLEGQDDNFDILQVYFKALQTMTVETSTNPDLDLLTFALSTHYFGVVMMEESGDSSCDTGNNNGEDSQQAEVSSKLLTSGEPAIIDVSPPITEEEFLGLSEKEKFERWVEAFQARMSGQCGPDLDFDDGLDDVRSRRAAASAEDYADKGKTREPPLGREHNPFPLKPFTAESISDLINWPEDAASDDGGPPSTPDDDGSFVWADGESSIGSPPPIPAFNFGEERYEGEGFQSDDNFGREYLEPEMGPVGKLPVIPQDPKLQKFIRESAIKFRDQLRARTVHLYEKRKAELARAAGKKPAVAVAAPPAPVESTQRKPAFAFNLGTFTKTTPIGIVYLTTSQNFSDPLHVGECNFGIYIAPEHWNGGRVSEVIHTVIEDAFKDHSCHRLQAILVDHQDIFDYLNLYASAGFRHEGIRRRAFYSPITTEWKDVTYLAIIATEWVHDRTTRSSRARLLPSSLWDEIISRHQREQEEFVWMEEKKYRSYSSLSRKRTSSLETIREVVPTALSRESGAESTGFSTDTPSPPPSGPSRRRRKSRKARKDNRLSFSSSESGLDSGWEVPPLLNNAELAGFRICDSAPSSSSLGKGSGTKKRSGRNNSVSSSSSWSALE